MFMDIGTIRELQTQSENDIASLIVTIDSTISSKILADNGAVRVALLAFGANQRGGFASAEGSKIIRVVEGRIRLKLNGHEYDLEQGGSVTFPAIFSFEMTAEQPAKVLATTVYPDANASPQGAVDDGTV